MFARDLLVRFQGSARTWHPEVILLAASLALLLLGNRHFLAQALSGREWADASSWLFGGALMLALLATNFILLALFAWGAWFKPMVAAFFVIAAAATHFIDSYGAFIDPSMLRNALHSHWSEASELLGLRLLLWLMLAAALPVWLLARVPVARRTWKRALVERSLSLVLALLALVAALWMAYQPLSSLMRNQRELRYLVTPSNVLWSAASLARQAQSEPVGPLLAVGSDAQAGPSLLARQRPRVLVLVVGETARAANWGLNGYSRQTTPQLAQLPVINFTQVTSCGTDTETSLPCMFAAIGRRQYNERRIHRSENLLHVAARAGVAVHWRDNQSGCKGVCEGFSQEMVSAVTPQLCSGGHCLDEGLLHDLDALVRGPAGAAAESAGVQAPGMATAAGAAKALPPARLVVLHQIGNHGPSYYRRVPPAFKLFQPACEEDDLRRCDVPSIVNAYDNALLYTDHVLAQLITRLQGMAGEVDSALIYVSDHGESIGEHGLFLHGVPYAIAPDVQKRVPMVMWFSPGFAAARGLDPGCMAARASGAQAVAASHDNLFHTILGLLDVRTTAREAALDLSQGCVRSSLAELARVGG